MNINTPGLSGLADAVEKLNARIDSMGSRMDAMVSGYRHEGPSKTVAERNKENDDRRAKSGSTFALAPSKRKAEHEKRMKADASKEVHEFESSNAKKTAQRAMESGDHKMAAKWVDYGTSHAKQAEDKAAKEDKIEAPPEDKKKDSEKRGDAVSYRSSGYELAAEGAKCQSKAEVLKKAKEAGLDKAQTAVMVGGFTSRNDPD